MESNTPQVILIYCLAGGHRDEEDESGLFFNKICTFKEALNDMNMALLKNICLAVAFLFCVAFETVHHGWANYDQEKTLDFKGTIVEIVYENPHASAKVKHQKKTWTVILAPVGRMESRGISAGMIRQGDVIRVVGYPHKKIKNEMRAERIFVDETKYELR